MSNDEGMTRLCVVTAWQAKSERRKVVSDYFSLPQHAIDESRIARFNVGIANFLLPAVPSTLNQ